MLLRVVYISLRCAVNTESTVTFQQHKISSISFDCASSPAVSFSFFQELGYRFFLVYGKLIQNNCVVSVLLICMLIIKEHIRLWQCMAICNNCFNYLYRVERLAVLLCFHLNLLFGDLLRFITAG